MRFDGRRATEIGAEEISQLVTDKVVEDGTVEFKRESYGTSDAGKKEFLRDVVSFANADGGYIVIGIEEADHCASRLCHVQDAVAEGSRLRDLCLQHIQPRIRDLEIIPKAVAAEGTDVDVVLIHIPESASRPHMVTLNDQTYFCRRYHDRKRSMSVEELQEAFGRRVLASHAGSFENLRSEVARLAAMIGANRLADLQPSEPVQNAISPAEVRKIMDLRFREAIDHRPYFRMTATPSDMSSVDLSTLSQQLVPLLESPPETRENGWVIYPVSQVMRTAEGWQAVRPGDRALILLYNGHLEYWHPCDDDLFQWGRQTNGQSPPELYPFAVCELPVNFTRLAKEVHKLSGMRGKLVFGMQYVNIRGFILRPGVPDSVAYLMPAPWVETQAYEEPDIRVADVVVAEGFDPDGVAFRLVEQVYAAFEIPHKYIPCFEHGQHFDINVNSSE